jgi:hypothetical protein
MKPVSDLHAAALRFAANGIPVFPCVEGTKRPYCLNGFHDASIDPAVIDQWWSENPRLNVAFSPHQAGLGIIDLDGEPGEAAWLKWQDEHGQLPRTYTVRTPRGGRHLYYRGILPATQSKLGEHVDTRGVGSYALIPPSVVDGKTYTLEDSRSPVGGLGPVNEYLEKLKRDHVKAAVGDLDLPANVSRAERLLRDYVARGNVAVEGHMGDAKTFMTACEILNLGLSAEKAHAILCDIWNPACVPPWDEDELETKVENASRYAQNEAGAWAVETAEDVFGSALDKLAPDLAVSTVPKRPRFKPWSLEELALLPAPTWLIQDMIPDQGLTLFYGPGDSYKTFLVLGLSMELATLGRTVVYLAGEGGISAYQRANAWRIANGVEGSIPFHVVRTMPWASDQSMVGEFIEEVRSFKPDLIVVDTAARMAVGLNENDARDMGQLVLALDTIKEQFGCAVIAIHHTGKDVSRGARGSDALLFATDAAFEVQANDKVKAAAVYCRRMKDAAKRETPWTYQGHEVAGSLAFKPTSYEEHKALTLKQERLQPVQIGGLLREMGIVGVGRGITTHVLATELVNREDPDLGDDDRDALVSRQSRVLGSLAKGPLEAYCLGSGPSLVWFVP